MALSTRKQIDVEDLIIRAQIKLSVIEGIAELAADKVEASPVEGVLSAEHWRGVRTQLEDVRALLDCVLAELPSPGDVAGVGESSAVN